MGGLLRSDGSRWTSASLYAEADDTIRARLLREAGAPSLSSLVGWEFDGVNTGWVAAPFRKFRKGFYDGPARQSAAVEGPWVQGFNVAIVQDGVDAPHRARPSEAKPFRHGFFRVYPAGSAPRRGRPKYPGALVLDYGLGGNGVDPSRLLRDYLVQLYPDDPDLLLGQGFGALPVVDGLLGRRAPTGRLDLGFFILTRARPHDFHGAT